MIIVASKWLLKLHYTIGLGFLKVQDHQDIFCTLLLESASFLELDLVS